MSETDKENRFCIPCNNNGNHTSLDHRQCPEKRKLVQEKIKAAKDKKKAEKTEDKRDTNLIQKTLQLANKMYGLHFRTTKNNNKRLPLLFSLHYLMKHTTQENFREN